MRKQRKHYSAEEKVAILKRHLVERRPVSEVCEELGFQPTVFYRWQKEFFENGAAAFQPNNRGLPTAERQRIDRPQCLENPRPKGGIFNYRRTPTFQFRLNQDRFRQFELAHPGKPKILPVFESNHLPLECCRVPNRKTHTRRACAIPENS